MKNSLGTNPNGNVQEMASNFYNTNKTTGTELKEAKKRNLAQAEKILKFLSEHPNIKFTACRIHKYLFNDNTPLTSTRRSLSDLKNAGFVVKLDQMVKGVYGRNVHLWKVRE